VGMARSKMFESPRAPGSSPYEKKKKKKSWWLVVGHANAKGEKHAREYRL